jgi:hypothetical protein
VAAQYLAHWVSFIAGSIRVSRRSVFVSGITAMTNLEEARILIDAYVIDYNYNENRLHSALQYLTPADYLKGEEHVNRCIDRRKEKLREAAKVRRIAQNFPPEVT